jgi:two-component system, NtrC family, sensor histidine kinase HydH
VMSEMAGYIVTETDRMNGLISNFLDFARPLRIHPATGDLGPVLDEIMRQHGEAAAAKGIQLRVTAEPLRFCFDSDLLRVALSNLVQNAIQATNSGGEVEIRADSQASSIRLFVRDTGDGIQPQHLENIFNPFFTTKPDGVGLGLAIVSKIVDEHNGRIKVFSQPAVGTTFEITLPKAQPHDEPSSGEKKVPH